MRLTNRRFGCLVASPAGGHCCLRLTPEVPDALKRAKAVFLGEVIDIIEPKATDENAPLPDRFFIIKFKIQRSWKGVGAGTREFSILSANGHYRCFAFPPVAQRGTYFVHAYPAHRADSWGIITICTRTTIVRFGANPSLLTPEAIDPFSDMKQLDIITKRVFSFDRAPFRRRV